MGISFAFQNPSNKREDGICRQDSGELRHGDLPCPIFFNSRFPFPQFPGQNFSEDPIPMTKTQGTSPPSSRFVGQTAEMCEKGIKTEKGSKKLRKG